MKKKFVPNEVRTVEEVAVDERVAVVEAEIEAAEAKRKADGVKETPEETEKREKAEALALRVARNEVTPEEKVHLDAATSRVKAVQAAIDAAKVVRDAQEATGVMETPGAKFDREEKEAKDLEEAAVVNKIEHFHIESTNSDMVTLSQKLTEVINYINTPVGEVKE